MSKDVQIMRGSPRIGVVVSEYDLTIIHPDITPFIINIKTKEMKELEYDDGTKT